jgi:hypothetical protein
MPDYRLEIVNRRTALARAADVLSSRSVVALDIETIEWWNRRREKISLIQFAYRSGEEIKVVIVDALADCDVRLLRAPLESAATVKVIHNAAFDATKLLNHFQIQTAPIFDTMLAARRSGERNYSLRSQAAAHLNIHLNKSQQRSDWSRRPLDLKQLDYAARDAYAALLLYEHQKRRNLTGDYFLKENQKTSRQPLLPLDEESAKTDLSPTAAEDERRRTPERTVSSINAETELSPFERAFLGIVGELSGRYHPEQLSVSVGTDRVGLAGWIADRFVGRETDIDEETAKMIIGDLCDRHLIRLNERQKLEITEKGEKSWREIKSLF